MKLTTLVVFAMFSTLALGLTASGLSNPKRREAALRQELDDA
jgi:hypothetical protein